MKSRIATFALLALAIAGCSKPEDTSNKPAPTASAPTAVAPTTATAAAPSAAPSATVAAVVEIPPEATKIFKERCALCHGEKGKGDGIGGKGMKPPPRNWTDATWQASVTDEQVSKTILKGGAAVGKSPTMPASPDLETAPKTVEGLMHIVRSFNGK